MRKLTLLISMLFLSLGMAWAQPAASSAPANGKWADDTKWYQIKTGGNNYLRSDVVTTEGYLLLTNSTSTLDDVALWCFVGDAQSGYTFYNRATGPNKPLAMYGEDDGAYAVLAENPTGTTAFDFTESKKSGDWWCLKQHGSAKNYWNKRNNKLAYWNSTDAVNGWGNSGKGDDGSALLFTEVSINELNCEFTDADGNVYTGVYEQKNGAMPSFSGVTIADAQLNGNKYTAKIEFPFPVSNEGGVINATTIASAAEAKKWHATDNSVIMVQTSGYDANDYADDWLWAIYPQFNNGAFTFKIKSIGKNKWIYTNATGSKVDTNSYNESADGADGAVQLSDNATQFDVVNSLTNGTFAFHYKVGDNNQYLSINSARDTNVYLGVHTAIHVGSDCYFSKVKTISPVAKIGEQVYYTLAKAITAAPAGSTITFVADINGNVTLSKNVTIDGAGKTYTGTMSVNKGLTVTVENVNFVNGGIDKPKGQKSSTGTYTIKNCTFVDEGKYAYPLRFYGAGTLNVENCTVKNYLYSFLYIVSGTSNLNINNVTVEDCPNYAVYFASGVNNATIEGLTVKNSDNGIVVNNDAARTLTIKDCKMENVTTAIDHSKGTSAITADVQGANDFGGATLSQYANCVLAEDATLAATTAGLNVTTNFEGKEVAYKGGVYSVVVKRDPAGHVAYRADVTDKTDREGIAILLKEVYAKNSLVVKVYNGETLMFTCTRLGIDDEGKVMFPVDGNTTANIVLWGKPSGSWNNEIHVAPTELNIPNRVEILADGVLVQNYIHDSGTILGTNLEKYLALECVKKFDAKIGNTGYETLAAAIEAAKADETIVLLRDVTASDIITINKAIALDGNGKTLTSTATRAINIDTKDKVVINNLTVNAGERAFNIINEPATVELNGVTATASNNAVMIATSAGAAKVTIDGCDFTGLAVVNVAGANSNVAIKNSKITNVDDTDAENYGAITVWTSADAAVVNVENTEIFVADDSKKAYVFPANATVNGVDEVGRIIVTVGDAGFDTLAEAIDYANGATITFVMNAEGPGVVINKNAVIDFNGCTYSFTEGVGSTGTETNGFQILKGNNVTLKNGTLNVADGAAEKFYILVQNYANLTVEGMTLDGTNLDKYSATDGDSYVLSNNSGTVNVIGSTIKANDEGALAFAMDACLKAPYEAPVVTVAEGSTINGDVEVSATLNMNGTLTGAIVINGIEGTVNGAEGLTVKTNVADHKVVNNNGAYKIEEMHYVAQVGEAKYETFAAAVAAAPAGATVTLIADAVESKTVVIAKALTIDGAGYTFTGAIEFDKSKASYTIKNVKFYGADTRVYALKTTSTTGTLTVENCEATGYTYGFLHANKTTTNVIVNNVTVKDVNYGVHSVYGTKVTLEDYKATNVKYPVYVQNYGTRNVVLNNCTFDGCENPLSIWVRNQTNKITFNFEGVNDMGKAEFCTDEMAVVNADAIVGTKVYATLADAVEAANAGDAVTLLRNVELSAYLTINKSITLNMGDYDITRNGGTALYVEGDVKEVVINATTGTVTGSQALWVANGLAKVNGGNFCGVAEAVYVTNSGKAEIYGGTFSSNNYDSFVLNKKDSDRGNTDITVYGGTFTGFNPADNAAEGKGTNFVAEGYLVVDNGDDTYTVKVNPAYGKVAKVGEDYYETLAAAVKAAAANATVELIAHINENVTLTKNVTIKGANFKYTGTMSANVNITVNVLDLNFVNAGFSKGTKSTNGNYTFKNCTFDGQGTYSRAIYVYGANKVVLENCTATGYNYFMYVPTALNNSVTVKNVTVENCSGYAVAFNSNAGKATFEKFTVKDTPIAIVYNNSANRALTLNNCTMVGVETAIAHNAGNKNITCTFVGVNDLGGADFSEYVVLKNAALAGTVIYSSLVEAVAAEGNEVKLLGNSTGAGVVINKDLTIDFNGKTYTFTEGVGSTGTESNGFQILKDNNVVLKNGTLNVAAASASKFYTIIQNYANLTVEDMNLDGTNLDKWSATDGDSYVFSNNSGKVVITGETNITANNDGDKAFAFDADKTANVTVKTTGNIAGKIEKADGASLVIYSGTYSMDVNEWCAEGYAATKVADNLWTVIKAIAQVGDVKYASIQDAIDAAQDGETVTLLADVELGWDDIVVANGYQVLTKVEGKNITLNLNGRKISVDHQSTTDRIFAVVYVADGAGLKVTGNGTIDVDADDNTPKVAYMFWKRGTAGYLVIENGNFHMDNSEDSMVYANSSNTVTVQGGTFVLDAFGTRVNGFPWIFNAAGNNANYIYVEGGSYNYDIRNQHWSMEVNLADGKTMIETENGLWTVAEAEAAIDGRGYLTLAAAVEAAQVNEIVTLLKDVTGAGLVINKSIAIDFGGYTYSLNEAVGSTGTASNGFQILKENDVTLMNGTLNVAEDAADKFYILVQNYANLTVKDMNLDGTNLDKYSATDGDSYVLSNNSGNVVITGGTNITANDKGDLAFAFDACDKSGWGYDLPVVKVYTTGKIAGGIENSATIELYSGTYTIDVNEWCALHHAAVVNNDGTWTVNCYHLDELVIDADGEHIYEFANENKMYVEKLTFMRDFSYESEDGLMAGRWAGIYLPFAVPVSALTDKYEVAYFNNVHSYDNEGNDGIVDDMVMEYIKITSGTLYPNTPYVIKPKTEEATKMVLELEGVELVSTAMENRKALECSSTYITFNIAGVYEFATGAELEAAKRERLQILKSPIYYSSWNGGWVTAEKADDNWYFPFQVYIELNAKPGTPYDITPESMPAISARVVGEENEDGTTTIYEVPEVITTTGLIFDLSGRRVLETEKGGIYIKDGKKVLVK